MSAPDVTRVRGDGSTTKTATATDSLEQKVRARAAKNTAYEKYKEQLHEFFDGKRELPSQLKEMLATRPGAEEHGFESTEDEPVQSAEEPGKKKKKKKKKGAEKAPPGTRRRIAANGDKRAEHVAALRATTSPLQAEQAIDAMRADGFSLPLDLDLLSKALGHKEEDVVAEALRGLVDLVEGPDTKGAKLLKGRLANVALMASSSEVRELCSTLQSRLA